MTNFPNLKCKYTKLKAKSKLTILQKKKKKKLLNEMSDLFYLIGCYNGMD